MVTGLVQITRDCVNVQTIKNTHYRWQKANWHLITSRIRHDEFALIIVFNQFVNERFGTLTAADFYAWIINKNCLIMENVWCYSFFASCLLVCVCHSFSDCANSFMNALARSGRKVSIQIYVEKRKRGKREATMAFIFSGNFRIIKKLQLKP
jgi:hypothetical protein